MATLNLFKAIITLTLATIFVSCAAQNDSKITTLPELINQETGLRELRFRRYDCMPTATQEATATCSENEVIKEEGENLRVEEITPWLTNAQRTIVNPTVMYNDLKQEMYVMSYLRMFDKSTDQFKDYKFEFKGDLKAYKQEYLKSKKHEYLKLTRVKNESKEVVNAIVYCYDVPQCKNISLVFSFLNFNLSGKSFIDSRPFQMDQRETEIRKEDALPEIAKRTITEPIYELPEDFESDGDGVGENTGEADDEALSESHNDDVFSQDPVGPVLPTENITPLCEGLTQGSESCPKYLLDPTLPKPFSPKEESNNKFTTPTFNKEVEMVDPLDEEVFPDELELLNGVEPREIEVNSDLLPVAQTYDPNLYHQFIMRLKIQKEFNATNVDSTTEMTSGPRPKARPLEKEFVYDERGNLGAVSRPKARPENFGPVNEFELKSSPRPKARPDKPEVVKSTQNFDPNESRHKYDPRHKDVPPTKVAKEEEEEKKQPEEISKDVVESDSVKAIIPFLSIDRKFNYDLSLCGAHTIKAKNIKYLQAKGFYSKGYLVKASHYKSSEYDTNVLTSGRSSKQHGSEITKQVIEFAGCVLEQRYGDRLKTYINDLSYNKGGKLSRHSSHQNGLDADISYPHLDDKSKHFDNFAANMTKERTIAAFDLARLLVYTDRVKILLTDNRIRKGFCKYLKETDNLDEYRELVERFMYHVRGHHNHYHVRMKCNKQNEGCVVQGDFKKDKICG